ncbi:uncharacterized protein C8orf48 homolog [Sorex araneus]|uniref:uncharacterized protein C8orf48 homolog n=1 Tax=Sorex araneus TaxID=42254 RepID=UPI0024337DD6|nr:uncharacterized protein C8orf48 homolog [Sorex araneus]
MDISAVSDLSHETFRSLTDEVQRSSSSTSSGGRQPWSSDYGSESETESITTYSEDGDKQSGISDSSSYEMELRRKWINCLKNKDTNSGQCQPDAKIQSEILAVSDEELNALQSFCTIKINLIKQKANSKGKRRSRHKMPFFRLDAEAPKFNMLNSAVPDELLNRTYFKNWNTTLKQVTTTKQHISSQCPDCNRKRAELAQFAFLKQKKTLLESLLLQEKIDEHLHTKDFLTHIAEAHKGLPRLSDDPRIIWKRLYEKSQIGYFGFERS